MPTYPIAVLNQSSAVTTEEAAAYCAAVQRQVSEHFAPFWGVDAVLNLYADAVSAPADAAWVVFLDDSDSAGALGYHDLNPQGLPLGKVFAGTDRLYGDQPSVTFSHEVLELLGDPGVDSTREVRVLDPEIGAERSYSYAVEVCDPCEEDRWGYLIDGVLVSDFVTPAWFQYWLPAGSARFDLCGRMAQP